MILLWIKMKGQLPPKATIDITSLPTGYIGVATDKVPPQPKKPDDYKIAYHELDKGYSCHHCFTCHAYSDKFPAGNHWSCPKHWESRSWYCAKCDTANHDQWGGNGRCIKCDRWRKDHDHIAICTICRYYGVYADSSDAKSHICWDCTKHNRRVGDWKCKSCKFVNFASRKKCYKCNNGTVP